MFDIDRYFALAFQFFANNIFIAIGVVIVLIFFIYKKPMETIKFLGFAALIVAVLYVMSLLTESGSQGVLYKHDAAEKTDNELMSQ